MRSQTAVIAALIMLFGNFTFAGDNKTLKIRAVTSDGQPLPFVEVYLEYHYSSLSLIGTCTKLNNDDDDFRCPKPNIKRSSGFYSQGAHQTNLDGEVTFDLSKIAKANGGKLPDNVEISYYNLNPICQPKAGVSDVHRSSAFRDSFKGLHLAQGRHNGKIARTGSSVLRINTGDIGRLPNGTINLAASQTAGEIGDLVVADYESNCAGPLSSDHYAVQSHPHFGVFSEDLAKFVESNRRPIKTQQIQKESRDEGSF